MKTTISVIIIIGLIAAITFLYKNDNQQLANMETIKVIASFPVKLAPAQEIIDSFELAFEESSYMAGNFKIEFSVLDDSLENGGWDSELEKNNAQRAARDQDVLLYVGPLNSGAAKVSMPILNQAGLAQLNIGNTWPGLTKVGYAPGEPGVFYPTGIRHYFRVNPSDDLQGPAAAVWAKELGFTNIYIIDDGEAYGKGIADIFGSKAQEIGLNILGQETINNTNTNFTDRINKIKELNPDLVYYGGIVPNGIVEFISQMKQLGLNASIMGPDGIMGQDIINRLGSDYAEGIYATTVGVPVSEIESRVAKRYVESFKEKYGKEPDAFSAFGYEAGKAALLALERAGVKDRAAVIKSFKEIKDFGGMFDEWSFDQNGDTTLKILSGNRVEDGAFKFEKRLIAP